MTDSTDLEVRRQAREAFEVACQAPLLDPDAMQTMIVARMAAMEDLDELLAFGSEGAAEKLIDVPFTLRGAIFARSDIPDSTTGRFAVMDVVDDDGIPHVMTTGAPGVVIKLDRLVCAGRLPIRARVIEVGQVRAGRSRPLYLVPANDPPPPRKAGR